MNDRLRQLPSVDRLLQEAGVAALLSRVPRPTLVRAVREALAAARTSRQPLPDDWAVAVADRLTLLTAASLIPVLNATGVVLHTNLGRAPLAPAAVAAMAAVAAGYSTLEYDRAAGSRGDRTDHCRGLLAELTGAEEGLAVNNAAGALVLALRALAMDGEVLISRGELIEIGGSFRIPEILEASGCRLREVGTTNRTHLADYQRELATARAVLTVHRSNFELRGYVATPEPSALATLTASAGIPYLYDLGGGLMVDLADHGLTGEPLVSEAIASGADLVIFSGDKLLGGPQAGCLVGRRELVQRCRRDPMARALRADKSTLAALAATLELYRDPERARLEIPVLAMLTLDPTELSDRASRLTGLMPASTKARTRPGHSAVGGGAFPTAPLPTTLVALDPGPLGASALAARLRLGDPAVVVRVEEGMVCLDPRTLPEESLGAVVVAVVEALRD
jgi:L-seryl-tRNA(Ser) seleniumtransferase